jgi:hypothetical protein
MTCTVIYQLGAKDICYEEDGLIFRIIGFGSGDVCLDTVDLFIRPLSSKCIGVLQCEKIR